MDQQTSIIPIAPTPSPLAGVVLDDLAGQLAPSSQRLYRADATHFVNWLKERERNIFTLIRSDFVQYRAHLGDKYSKATAARMLTVARRLLDEAVNRGDLVANPAKTVKGWKAGENESTHRALEMGELRQLLKAFDLSTARGKRDLAIISLLVRTGMRRAECAALTIGDLKPERGHYTAIIRHGKGDRRRVVKIPEEVMAQVNSYLEAAGRKEAGPGWPLFIQFDKGDHPVEASLTEKTIERVVASAAGRAGIGKLTPHDLRATFITLTLEGGAKLHQVQYAAGHVNPMTTERYQRRKLNLEDNASDYLKP